MPEDALPAALVFSVKQLGESLNLKEFDERKEHLRAIVRTGRPRSQHLLE